MARVKGFTLIELIVVIVILGILSITAAPQFINFTGDARAALLQQLKASMNSSITFIYAKASIAGLQRRGLDTTGTNAVYRTVSYNSSNYDILYGYPAASASGIIQVLNIEAADWDIYYNFDTAATRDVSSADVVYISPAGFSEDVGGTTGIDSTDLIAAACYISYQGATSVTTEPSITVVSTSC